MVVIPVDMEVRQSQLTEILFFGHGTIAVAWSVQDPDISRSICTPVRAWIRSITADRQGTNQGVGQVHDSGNTAALLSSSIASR